ncbi:MAG: phenylacetate--CoA ligase family protein [Phycisphaerales bacterium]|nr:MAG: phenylacetate--CoA ligase family protein [Phycisphaerales bacterium]
MVRHILSPLHESLLGRNTFACLRELEVSQWQSPEKLRGLQRTKLRRLLVLAAANCSYYHDLFKQRAVDPQRGDPLDALARLPLLDKTILRTRRRDMIRNGSPRATIRSNTGGSTGEPLTFYFDRRRVAYDKAARMRTHRWFGVEPGDREIYLWGAPAELKRQDRARILRDRLTNEMLLSAFNMSPRTMREYLGRIETFRPVSLFGYPSSIALLCEFGRSNGIIARPTSLKAVFVTGEVLDDRQRSAIERYFGVPVANGYGSREGGFLAHQCPQGSTHVTSENVIMEIVDDGGAPVPQGESGEIVITHLDNYAMPFIRYRTGDVGRLLNGPCACGRGLQVMDVVAGRRTDFLVATDGTVKHALSLIYVLREIDSVRQFQILQDRNRDVRIDVVATPEFGRIQHNQIDRGVRRQLGRDVRVSLALVDRIEALPSGKHRHVVSEA